MTAQPIDGEGPYMRPQLIDNGGVAMTVQEYHAFEESHLGKYEYIGGFVYAQAGATERHNDIQMNVLDVLRPAARRGGCRAYGSDMKLVTPDKAEYYPDAMVVCTPRDPNRKEATSPLVLVEVTSSSTERIDRGEKLEAYQSIPSLRAYLIVSHREPRIDYYTRDSELRGFEHVTCTEGAIWLAALDVALDLGEVFR